MPSMSKRAVFVAVVVSLFACGGGSTGTDGGTGGGAGGGAGGSCSGGNTCLTVNGQAYAFNASWQSLVGSKVGVLFTDSAIEFGVDIGTYHDTKSYSIIDGSLSSTVARMHFDDKTNNKHYVATAGTLTTTAWSTANEVTANFTATFKDQATNDTFEVTGQLVAVPKQ